MEKHLVKIVLYPLGIGIILLFINTIFDARILERIGTLGFIPLLLVTGFAWLGSFWNLMDTLIPNFKAKPYVVDIIVLGSALVFAVLFAVNIYDSWQ